MKRTVFACAGLIAALVLAPAPDAAAADITIRGASNCALWAKGRAAKDATYEKTWLTGYFTGLAIGFDINFWGTKGKDELDNDALWKRVDAYCVENAGHSLVQAAEKIFLEQMRSVK